MNLLILTQYFYPEQFRINAIAQELLKRGHTVTVLTGHPNYPKGKTYTGYKPYQLKKELWDGITIYRVPIIPRGKGKNIQLMLNYLSFMINSSIFSLFLKNKKFDACFVHQPGPIFKALAGVVLKKLYKVPLHLWVQDLWPDTLSATGRLKAPLVEKVIHRFVRLIYQNTDQIWVSSEAFISSIMRFGPKKNPIYLPNTCEDFYQPVSTLERQLMPDMPDGFKVMFTGNVGSAQALPTIIEAAKILKDRDDIKWVIVGVGSELEKAKSLVKKYTLETRVIFLGGFPATSMPQIIAHADVCLATLNKSPIFSLTLPAKIQSYMACAKPIICAIDGEASRVINEANCGVAVESENPNALANAVIALRDRSIENKAQLGKNGRIYYEKHFQFSSVIDKLTSIITKEQKDT
ncbi:MAG: hypothetical protein A3F12_00745 [Gammaproteobacteria bacterium RIFCSPHIGHO2_12_FULL_38_14]|nr:MAG: hypothetical protein A3F12_00745 [Gammaproteobacteria bacterium RIFCSPHIGHO2_12_FULL_38_14]